MILSIESSCDDSSIAITSIEDKKLLFYKKISQELEHSKYGGVVPELASRLHLEALPEILEECKPYFSSLKAVAVTNEPGLSVTLNEGIMMAKALSLSLKIPLIEVNHLIGHIYSVFIEKEAIFPLSVILVSGGHTKVLLMDSPDSIKELATTTDDSFGESFDKVAKMLDLGYPGGPVIEKLAQKGEHSIKFPIPLQNSPRIAFSYSGLKNAVRLKIAQKSSSAEDIAYSFQYAAIKHLLQKTQKVFKLNPPQNVCVVGGAGANQMLREEINKLSSQYEFNVYYPLLKFCSDNAAMIGRAAIDKYLNGSFIEMPKLKAKSSTQFSL